MLDTIIEDESAATQLREQKVIILPDYGRDVPLEEALEVASKVTFVASTVYGITFKVADGMTHSHIEYTGTISRLLASFLLHYSSMLHNALTKSDLVLNLDCGYGFCGIAALQLGYKNVIFADVHADVLCNAVWPNILMNSRATVANARCIASSGWMPLSEYLSDPGPNKWTVIYKRLGLVLATISSIRNNHNWERLHSLLLRHLTGSGIALVGLHTAIRADTPLPVPPYLRLCFEHALLQSPACEGTHMCDIVRIARRQ